MRYLVHGVGTQHHTIGPGPLQPLHAIGQYLPGLLPVAAALQEFNLVKVNTGQYQFGGMKAAKARLYGLVDVVAVGNGGFPAHAADEADGFHRNVDSSLNFLPTEPANRHSWPQ